MGKSIIRHDGFVVSGIKLAMLKLYTKLASVLSGANGRLHHDSPLIEEALVVVYEFNKTKEPLELNEDAQPEQDGICGSYFTDRYITAEMKSELVKPVECQKVSDEEAGDNDETVSYTKRWETKDIMLYSDDSCLKLLPSAKDKKKGHPDYAARAQYDNLRRELAKAVECCVLKHGIKVDDVVYHYFTTSSGGLKQGKHYYISDRVHADCSVTVRKINLLSKKANLAISKHLQYLSLLLTDANKLDIDGFVENAIVVEVNPLMKTIIEAVMVVPTHDVLMNCVIDDKATYENNWTDGAILANSDFAARYNLHLVQMRGLGVKGLAQFISFRHLAADLHLTEEQCQVVDIFGVQHDIRNVSCILTKDSFKYLKLLQAGNYTSLYSFFADFGFTDFYATNIFANHIEEDETWNFTKQFFSAYARTAEIVAEIAKLDADALTRFLNMSHEEYVAFVASLYEGQAEQAIMSLDVDNGAAAYSEEAKRKVEEAYTAKFRDATQKWRIKGHCLKAMPDIIALFCAVLGIEHSGLCGDVDAVYCMAYSDREVLINRNPVIANDTAVQRNLYSSNNFWNKYVSIAACYFGKKSKAPKMLGADFDGDSVNVTNNAKLIERIKATNNGIKMPMLQFYDLKDEQYIAEDCLKNFSGSANQIAACIVYAADYSKFVGISAARISRAFCEINRAVEEHDYAKAEALYLHDVAPLAITEQLAVDASKTLAFYEWNKNGTVLGTDWYEDSDNGKMITKEYKKVSNNPVSEHYTLYRSDAMYVANKDGFEACWNDGSNIGAMHDYFASRFPARFFYYYDVHYGMSYDFNKDDFTVDLFPTTRNEQVQEEHVYNKKVFTLDMKPETYKPKMNRAMKAIFDKYDVEIHSVMDADAAVSAFSKLYNDRTHGMSRYQRIADLREAYAIFSKLNKDAYLYFARRYVQDETHCTLSLFLETTSRVVNGTLVSEAANFAASEGKF